MRIFGSLTAFKDMLSNFATVIGTANVDNGTSAAVTLASGLSSTGNSGDVVVRSGTANAGTRGSVALDGGDIDIAASGDVVISGATVNVTQNGHTAVLEVPADVTTTFPSTTGALKTASEITTEIEAAVDPLRGVAPTVTGTGSGICDCGAYGTFYSTVSGTSKTFNMHNMVEGVAVTLIITDGALDTALAFNCFSDAGTTGLTERYSIYGATLMASNTSAVALMRVGSNVFITLTHGFTV